LRESGLSRVLRFSLRAYLEMRRIQSCLSGCRTGVDDGTADQAPMSPLDRGQFLWDAASIVALSRRATERVFAAFGAR
jgi:hypothetical protein